MTRGACEGGLAKNGNVGVVWKYARDQSIWGGGEKLDEKTLGEIGNRRIMKRP